MVGVGCAVEVGSRKVLLRSCGTACSVGFSSDSIVPFISCTVGYPPDIAPECVHFALDGP